MKKFELSDMEKGWFIGDFDPSVIKTKNFEVGIKQYKAGDRESAHLHKKSEEITVVVEGKIKMAKKEFSKGQIILLDKNEVSSFEALENCTTVVVKIPSIQGDKFVIDDE